MSIVDTRLGPVHKEVGHINVAMYAAGMALEVYGVQLMYARDLSPRKS
jgi:hypothetical protein